MSCRRARSSAFVFQDRAITAERRAANLEAALKKVRRQLRLRKERTECRQSSQQEQKEFWQWRGQRSRASWNAAIAAAEARQGARLAKLAEGGCVRMQDKNSCFEAPAGSEERNGNTPSQLITPIHSFSLSPY
ncbi:unnamed protein product [Durusdinium trenchii]|uniref:Uncharacterized protein n=1 Tax=Durusdinium trenchii TaxID=1381693 RepID=A0ABP0LRK0_9DINO